MAFARTQYELLRTRLPSYVPRMHARMESLIHDPSPFALVIGIDRYPKLQSLTGAVADAKAMRRYLRDALHVPAVNIVLKLDHEATRKVIIDELLRLSSVQPGAPIIIFFAGHGTEASSTTGGAKIQQIVPYDYLCYAEGSTQIPGGIVHAIPDRTIGELLSQIADRQRGKITLILDCCHSGSGSRDTDLSIRSVESSLDVPPTLDEHLFQSDDGHDRTTAVSHGFLNAGLRSHVLLAACESSGYSQEEHGRGCFTKALLKALYAVGSEVESLTYGGLMERIVGLPHNQHPQCEGFYRSSTVFFGRPPPHQAPVYPLQRHHSRWVIAAGSFVGISQGAVFHVYLDDPQPRTPSHALGTLTAETVEPHSTTMAALPQQTSWLFPEGSVALQISGVAAEALRLHVADRRLLVIVQHVQARQNSTRGEKRLELVARRDAQWEISAARGYVALDVLDERAARHGYRRLPLTDILLTADDVFAATHSIAHFAWHLRRAPPAGYMRLSSRVAIEFIEVVKFTERGARRPIAVPKMPIRNLINREGEVVLNVDEHPDAMYAIRIENTASSQGMMYVSVFYFDQSNLSIEPYYTNHISSTSRNAEPSLPPRGTLEVGYGTGGAVPYTYFVPEGADMDMGYLKVFLSTEAGDLSHIAQPPLRESRAMTTMDRAALGREPAWDAVVIPVVLRRAQVQAGASTGLARWDIRRGS